MLALLGLGSGVGRLRRFVRELLCRHYWQTEHFDPTFSELILRRTCLRCGATRHERSPGARRPA